MTRLDSSRPGLVGLNSFDLDCGVGIVACGLRIDCILYCMDFDLLNSYLD